MTGDRRQTPERRQPAVLAPPKCPVCRVVPKKVEEAGLLVPIGGQYIRHAHLKSTDDVTACFKCEPCDLIFCVVRTRRRAA